MPCEKCGNKLILGQVDIESVRPDPEPYNDGEEVGDGLDQISYDFSDWFMERLFCYQVFERECARDLLKLHNTIMRKKLKELYGIKVRPVFMP